MQIQLLNQNKIWINLNLAKIEDKIKKLKRINTKKNIFENFSKEEVDFSKETADIKIKEIIKSITFLIDELDYSTNFKEVQNIIKKKNPSNDNEHFIYNLFDSLMMFWKSKKIIHQNNVFMLYQILNTRDNLNFGDSLFRTVNESKTSYSVFDIWDYNLVPSSFNELIDYINHDKSLLPIIKMHIIQVHFMLISPFKKQNTLLSKILSIWYFLSYGNKDDLSIMSIQNYLNAHILSKEEYHASLQKSLENNDYTFFIEFILDHIIRIQENQNLTIKICNFFQTKRRIFLAEYEKKFLFTILFHEIDEFDWKIFRKKTKWKVSKQYIIRNLTQMVKYSILTSKSFKNRKFFFLSRMIKKLIQDFNHIY